MAKKKKKSRSKRFVIGMIIYAVIFLISTAVGLRFFWNYIDAYEQTRPKNTIDAYLASLTAEKLSASDDEVLAQIDTYVQSEEQARQVIQDSLTQDFSYAKKSSESTDTRQVYVIRCGRQNIGQVVIAAGAADNYGFRAWTVAEETYDFSYLLSEVGSVTVPSDFTVSVNGNVLDSSYITAENIQYEALEDFYDDYKLPTMVTYSVSNVLGDAGLEVADREGNPVEITEDTAPESFLPTCSDSETEELKTFMADFLKYYVLFTGSANGHASSNYNKLKKYLVPDGELAQRLYKALDGLQFAQSGGDTIDEIIHNRFLPMEDDRYMCDVTYLVTTKGKKGAVQTTNNLQVIVWNTADGLKVEALTSY